MTIKWLAAMDSACQEVTPPGDRQCLAESKRLPFPGKMSTPSCTPHPHAIQQWPISVSTELMDHSESDRKFQDSDPAGPGDHWVTSSFSHHFEPAIYKIWRIYFILEKSRFKL